MKKQLKTHKRIDKGFADLSFWKKWLAVHFGSKASKVSDEDLENMILRNGGSSSSSLRRLADTIDAFSDPLKDCDSDPLEDIDRLPSFLFLLLGGPNLKQVIFPTAKKVYDVLSQFPNPPTIASIRVRAKKLGYKLDPAPKGAGHGKRNAGPRSYSIIKPRVKR